MRSKTRRAKQEEYQKTVSQVGIVKKLLPTFKVMLFPANFPTISQIKTTYTRVEHKEENENKRKKVKEKMSSKKKQKQEKSQLDRYSRKITNHNQGYNFLANFSTIS